MKHDDDTRNLNLLADQLEALWECVGVAALAAGGLAADMHRHGEHPALAGGVARVRAHLDRVKGPLGAAQGLLGSVMDTREGHGAAEPTEPAHTPLVPDDAAFSVVSGRAVRL